MPKVECGWDLMNTLEIRIEQNKILNNINTNLANISESLERQNENMVEVIKLLAERNGV